MKQADRIRQFVLDIYITPARTDRCSEITVRAGDIHKRMELKSAMPAVCSAVGGKKFLQIASVSLRHRAGPPNGSNVYFTFNLTPDVVPPRRPRKLIRSSHTTRRGPTTNIDFTGTLVLVSCVKSKLSHAARAKDLYTSHWFTLTRDLVESANAQWFALSALYGLVDPAKKVAPYELSLRTMGVAERRAWAARVLDKLLPAAKNYRRVLIFAGERYREFLVEPLRQAGLDVVVPMEGLTQGKQLSWLVRASAASAKHGKYINTGHGTKRSRVTDTQRFYELLDQLAAHTGAPRLLEDLSNFRDWPRRGVYFFCEPTELRNESGSGLRVIRVGTHAVSSGAKSTLGQRLRSHRGTVAGGGNHRRSIFRVLVGQALLAKDGRSRCPSWGVKNDIRKTSEVLGVHPEILKSAEAPIERYVSQHLSTMPFHWLEVDDEPGPNCLRSFLERNSIALLSNIQVPKIDTRSANWLGRYSNREAVRESGLWNQQHTSEVYDPGFLDVFESLIAESGASR